MLHDPARHEPLRDIPWHPGRVRDAITRIVADTEARYRPGTCWPMHPRDLDAGNDASQVATPLYHGACGVLWALQHLQALGAVRRSRDDLWAPAAFDALLEANRAWLGDEADAEQASYMMGETPIQLLACGQAPTAARADRLAALIAGNVDHPARELMWGAPGTLLAALFLHGHTGDPRWATLFRHSAERLWSQLQWSAERGCAYWTQDLYGRQSTYLDAVHGFVATASPLIRGRHLLDAGDWAAWQACIENTIVRTAVHEGAGATWPAMLETPPGGAQKRLMQFCHGAPGFVICLAEMPGKVLDDLLLAGGEATWAAGPLNKGSNLCHGTGGNGYAFLKLHRRTGDPLWLQRARAFAMHGIAQTDEDAARYGQLRYSLWTGDPGFAIYLWDCLHGGAAFPTLDVFFAGPPAGGR